MENTPSKSRFVLITAFLLLVLFILPAGSWYYLKKGADYRIEHIKDMAIKGEFNQANIVGITEMNLDSLKRKTVLVGVTEGVPPMFEKMNSQLEMLIDQFGDRKDIKVIQLITKEGREEGFNKSNHFKHVWIAHQSLKSIKNCGLTEEIKMPFWALVDDKGQVRNYYSLDDFEKLVVQSAMILPVDKRQKVDLKRDEEI